MMPEDAQAEAIRRIHHARDTGADWLDLGDLPIEAVPDEIGILRDQLRVLGLGTQMPVRRGEVWEWWWPGGRLPRLTDISSLSSLSGLIVLNLKGCSGLTDANPLSSLTGLTTLDLSGCSGLTDLGPLAPLTSLITLDLESTSVTDLGPLSSLTNLTTLDLLDTNVKDLGPLSSLTCLIRLDLTECKQLTNISPLSFLTHLVDINLWNTGVWHIPPLSMLTSLTTLDLGYTSVKDLGPLSLLKSLTTLNLSFTDVTSVNALSVLTRLTTLNLSGTSVKDLGPLSMMTGLLTLDLSGDDQLTDVGPLSLLTGLTTLDLSEGSVKDVRPLSLLTHLTDLNLLRTGVSSVSPLSGLTKLTTLNLSWCSGFPFEPLRSLLPTLCELCLYQADLTDLPDAICGARSNENALDAVRAYYDDLGADPVGDAERKVFLLGNGRVGKTKLARRLMGQDYGAEHEPSTHGVRLGLFNHTLDGLAAPVRLNLWDFGGQDIYLGSHAVFLQGQAVFLLLWHPEHELGCEYNDGGLIVHDRPLAYWLDYLRGLAGVERDGRRVVESPILLIRSQCDTADQEAEPPVLPDKATFPNLVTLSYGAKNQYNRKLLEAHLDRAIRRLVDDRRKRPQIGQGRKAVRDAIRAMQAKPEDRRKRIMERTEFERLCAKKGGISSPAEFLKFLHRSGVVFYQQGAFGDRVVIDQGWALDAIYTVFHRRERLQDAIRAGDGRFTRLTLDQHVWGDIRRTEKATPYPIEDQRTFLGLMTQCGIAFAVRTDHRNPDRTEYTAPDLLPPCRERRAADFDRWRKAPGPSVTLRYEFLHDGVIRTFLARIGDKAGEHGEYWKFGCAFYDQKTDSDALIRAHPSTDPNRGAGAITLDARPSPGSTSARPEDLLRALVKIATELPYVTRPTVDPPEFATGPIDRPRPPRPAPAPEPPDSPASPPAGPSDARDLLRPAFPPRTLFISYRHAESGNHVREVVPALVTATGHPSRVVWDNQLQTDDSISEFVKRPGTIPVLVVVLGPSYLQSRFCMEEMYTAWESSGCRWETFQARVLPLILADARIDDPLKCAEYAQYWLSKSQELWARGPSIGEGGFRLVRRMEAWSKWLADALHHLNDPLLPRGWDSIKADGFKDVLRVLEDRFRRLKVD